MIRFLNVFFVALLLAVPARAGLEIQEITTPGGIKVWLVEEHSIPIVALELRFKGGAALDVPGKRGAIYLMNGLLEEGAGDMDATEFLKATEEVAARFGFDAYGDAVAVSAEFLSENKERSLELLRLAITEPRFDQAAFERVQGQVLSIVQQDLKDPNDIAWTEFDKQAFGAHPYGSSNKGSVESVSSLTREDMIEAHRNSMARDQVFVAVVGDVRPEELGDMLDPLLADLPETGAAIPPRIKAAITGGTTVIDHPSPQAVAIFGHEGIKRDDPDFFPVFVMNQIFGASGFTSRLTEEVREKRGLTYGVYTYIATYDLSELFVGSVASANDRIAEAIEVIRQEWRKLAESGVTEEELIAAKKFLTGAYPLRFDGNARIAKILVGMQLDNLPTSYSETRNDKVNAVTREDIARAAKRLLKPDDLRIVVVGRPVGIESTD